MDEISGGGLHGYLSVSVDRPDDAYTYGMSWYSAMWPLTASPLLTQVGLPSTWITPNNTGIDFCLCVHGTAGANAGWCDEGNCEFLFQTIEGGGGMWGDTAFPARQPKWRINAVPDAYTNYIGSPGWQNGGVKPLGASQIGMAQISNRLLMPPDGLTFDGTTDGALFGAAWMALPLTPPRGHFLLQTKTVGDADTYLEGNKPGPGSTLDGASFMTPGKFSGQNFTLVDQADGWFTLETQQTDSDRLRLEGNKVASGSYLGGAAYMADGDLVDGQRWRLEPVGGGYFRLVNRFTVDEGLCLHAPPGLDATAPLGGAAYMAPKADSGDQLWRLIGTDVNGVASTGPNSWGLFLSAENFNGLAGCLVADLWSALSQDHPEIAGRGLDLRPAQMVSGVSMEFNTVPYFSAVSSGTTYTRIPEFSFPAAGGETLLMSDISVHSPAAVYEAFDEWLYRGGVAPAGFVGGTSVNPPIRPTALGFTQKSNGAAGARDLTVSMANYFETRAGPNGSFLLDWKTGSALPAYFRHDGDAAVPLEPHDVPADTQLQGQTFTAKSSTGPLAAPTDPNSPWNNPGPHATSTASLADGSTVTYGWYRFRDQPSLAATGWSSAQLDALQAIVERIHSELSSTAFLPRPSSGSLASLDPALLVRPPAGCETGYVPIVQKQL